MTHVHALREPRAATVCAILETLLVDAFAGGKDKSPITDEQRRFLDPLGITSGGAQADFTATAPPVNAAAFSNPSLGTPAPAGAAPAGGTRTTDAYGNPVYTDSTGTPQANSGFNGGYQQVSNIPSQVGPAPAAPAPAQPQLAPQGTGGLRTELLRDAQLAGTRVAPTAGPVTVNAPAPAVATTAQAGQAGAHVIDQGLLVPGQQITAGGVSASQGARAQQQDSVGLLRSAATGAAPSAAEIQQRAGLQQTLRGNLALAASARGTAANRVAAQRAAADANTAASLGVTGQTAALRAQEQATARGQLASALQGVRGQDIETGQLGIGQQQVGLGVGQANLGAQTQTALANLDAGTRTALANQASQLQASLGNLQAGTTLAGAQLNADQNIQLANLNAQLQQTGMNDALRLQTLGQVLGIDARTQEGQIALAKLLAESDLESQRINASVAVPNAQLEQDQRAGVAGAIGGGLAAILG